MRPWSKADKTGNIFANDDTVQWEQLEDSSSVMQTQEQFDKFIPIVSQPLPPLSNSTPITSNLVTWNDGVPVWDTDIGFNRAQGLSVPSSYDASAATASTYPLSDYSFGQYYPDDMCLDNFQQTSQHSAGDDLELAPINQGPEGLGSSSQMSELQSLENIVPLEQMPSSPVRRTSVNLYSDTLPAGDEQVNPVDISTARRDCNKHCGRRTGKAPRSGVQKQGKRKARVPQQQSSCLRCILDHKKVTIVLIVRN